MPDAPSWTELLVLMIDVPEPEPTVHGAIRSLDGDDESRRYYTLVHSSPAVCSRRSFWPSISVFAVSSTSECSTSGAAGQAGVTHCTHSGAGIGTQLVFLDVLVTSVLGPIFSTACPIRTARRVA